MKAADDDDLEGLLLALPSDGSAMGRARPHAGQDVEARRERIWALACQIEPDMARVMDWWQHDVLVALEGLTPRQALEGGKGERLERYLMAMLADG